MADLVVQRASDFVSAIGVNIHLPYTDGAYANVNTVLADLKYLGLDHVRDWVINDKPYPGDEGQLSYPVAAAAGIKFDMNVISGSDIPHTLSILDAFAAKYPGSITAIEGPNEVNNWPVSYGGLTGDAGAVAFQNALYQAVKADPYLGALPVYNMTSWPELVGGHDDANLHIYAWSGDQPFQTLQSAVTGEHALMPGDPVVITEAGYYTLPNVGQGGVDDATQAKLTLNLLFDAAKLGVQTTYLYQLLDAYADPNGIDSEKHFGLFDVSNTPKPLANAIHNLTAIIADPGAAATSFALTTPNFTTSGLTSIDSSLVLEKSSGVTDLVFWSEPDVWDEANHRALASGNHTVTLTLDKAYAQIVVFDPLVGTSSIATFQDTATVQFSLSDHPVIIEIGPAASAVSPILAHGAVLDGAGGGDTLVADAGGGVIRGMDGADSILGGADADDLNGNVGDDTVDGRGGADVVRGGKGADSVTGGAGDDLHVNGNLGDDVVHGGTGNDTVYGGQGADTVYGDEGDDLISGDLGNDSLFGGAGADRFVFASSSGQDWIGDFNAAEGDRIQLAPGAAYTLTAFAGQAMIDLGGDDHIVLAGVSVASFNADWIVYG